MAFVFAYADCWFSNEVAHILSCIDFVCFIPFICLLLQVCWHWKYLTEIDNLWMPKCLRLGWILPFMPGQYEVGVWKRNYVENIKTLQIMNPKVYNVHNNHTHIARFSTFCSREAPYPSD